MKTNFRKKPLTFGEFITHVYDVGGKRKASGIVWLAVNSHLVKFKGAKRFVIA